MSLRHPAPPPAAPSGSSSSSPRGTAEPVLLGRPITLDDLEQVARHGRMVSTAPEARARVAAARRAIDALTPPRDPAPREGPGASGLRRSAPSDEPAVHVYGVNTGFGALSEVSIVAGDVRALQKNLVRSHACGIGPDLTPSVVRAIMLLRAQVLALGHSGVRNELVDALVAVINRGVLPRIPAQGSVGASGDLAPLAHLALVLIGEGEADFEGCRMSGAEALERAQLAPVELEAKEGLSLINGTQYMAAIGALALIDGLRLAKVADIAGAMSLEALRGSQKPFDARLMEVRPHPGQAASAANLRRLLVDSPIAESHRHCGKVQDAYSLRCMPQVHGASRDALDWAREVVGRELNAVTDNPLVFENENGPADVLSGGNFHGQPLALVFDLAAIALAELANISERRVEQLVNPTLSSGLSPFLAKNSGLESGFMLAQVASASLVSENKILAHPASVDSIPSSAGKEDHVSMGSVGARKLAQIVENVGHSLAIEILTAAAGLDQRLPLEPGRGVRAVYERLRREVSPLDGDRPLYRDIERVRTLIDNGELAAAAEHAVGALA